VTSLFGTADDEDDNEQVPRSPFILTGLPPEVRFKKNQNRIMKFY
jgi:hypothetical protein